MTKLKSRSTALALSLSLFSLTSAWAQGQPPPPTPIDAAAQRDVVKSLSAQLQSSYIFPDVARDVSTKLIAKQSSGGYAAAKDAQSFAKALAGDLRAMGKDSHFQVAYAPEFRAGPSLGGAPTAAQVEEARKEITANGFGIERVERLSGNIGYLDIRGFGPTEHVGEAITSAMRLLSGTSAMIIDLRRNGGGEPSSVAHLMSHFFAQGDERHLNDIYTRPNQKTRQYWTNPAVPVRYSKPVYVLISARTFSGGEECAYDFQTQKRATLVGEVTGGGANPGEGFALSQGFAAFIPTGKAVNPVTGSNWEHVGVKPDVAVPAADALKTAHATILRSLVADSKEAGEREWLQDMLAGVESGVVKPVDYGRMR